MVATADERAAAWAPWLAVAWLRASGTKGSASVFRALEEGSVLLVVQPLGIVTDAVTPPPTDVVDLADLTDEALVPLRPPEEHARELHTIEVLVVNAHGQPQAGIAYELVLPDGSVHLGRTGPDGVLRLTGLTQVGNCRLSFPEVRAPVAA
jgi:hypothetical protein